jgi:hypothetical protein
MNKNIEILALNQAIFKKQFTVGIGFKEGEQNYPDKSFELGWFIYVNGRTPIPKITGKTESIWEIGTFYHPYLLEGMPSKGCYINYSFCVSDTQWILVVGLKLDGDEEKESTEEIACLMNLEDYLGRGELTLAQVAKEFLKLHFLVFLGIENSRDIYNTLKIEKTEDNEVLLEALDEYLKLVDENQISYKTW